MEVPPPGLELPALKQAAPEFPPPDLDLPTLQPDQEVPDFDFALGPPPGLDWPTMEQEQDLDSRTILERAFMNHGVVYSSALVDNLLRLMYIMR